MVVDPIPSRPTEKLAFAGATVIDGTGTDAVPDAVLTVYGDKVVEVGNRPRDAKAVDVGGLAILPGLIDAHTHLGWVNRSGAEPAAVAAAELFRNCELALDAGFTTVRDVGGIDGGIAAATASGQVRGPRILPSGPTIVQSGGHGDRAHAYTDHVAMLDIPGLLRRSAVVDGADEMRRAVRRAFKMGATQIKLCITGGVVSYTDSLDDTQFSVDEMRVAAHEAAARGSYVTAHAHNTAGIRLGLEAGIRCFEHASHLDEDTARMLADAGAVIVPTLAVARLGAENLETWGVPNPEALRPRFAGIETAMTDAMLLAREYGIPTGSGSDLLGANQNRRGLELVIKAEAIGAMEAIVSATSVNAKILRRADLGALAPGQTADFIAVDGDPLADPALFDDPDRVILVMKEGQIVKDRR